MGYEVYMVTPDKDYGQLLVKPNVYMWKPPAFGNEREILDAEKIKAKWDIARVDQVIDMLGLMGDAADNIPGIPGVGEKTAKQLVAEYGTVENVIANAENIKGKLGERVREHADMAIMSKKLATIITNVPVDFDEQSLQLEDPDKELLRDVFAELEFRALAKRCWKRTFLRVLHHLPDSKTCSAPWIHLPRKPIWSHRKTHLTASTT